MPLRLALFSAIPVIATLLKSIHELVGFCAASHLVVLRIGLEECLVRSIGLHRVLVDERVLGQALFFHLLLHVFGVRYLPVIVVVRFARTRSSGGTRP
jgi:hypothetical protein